MYASVVFQIPGSSYGQENDCMHANCLCKHGLTYYPLSLLSQYFVKFGKYGSEALLKSPATMKKLSGWTVCRSMRIE